MRELMFTVIAFSLLLFAGFLVASCVASEEDGFLIEDDIEEVHYRFICPYNSHSISPLLRRKEKTTSFLCLTAKTWKHLSI